MKKLVPPDVFVVLCGLQLGIFIQLRKLEMGFDTFWNPRLLLLLIAAGLALLLAARAYAALLALIAKQDFRRLYRIEAVTYCPLFIFTIFPLLRKTVLSDTDHSFKVTLAVVVGLVLLLKACSFFYYIETSEKPIFMRPSAKGIFKTLVYIALFIALIGLLDLHYLSLQREMRIPADMKVYRDVAIPADGHKRTYEYRKSFLNEKMEMNIVIPTGGRLIIGFKSIVPSKAELSDNPVLKITMAMKNNTTAEKSSYSKLVPAAQRAQWLSFRDFVNRGKSSEFRIVVKSDLANLQNGVIEKIASFQTTISALFKPLPAPARIEALKVRTPRIELEQSADMPNVVYVSIDMLRPDHMGLYGYHRDTTPNIDRFAQENIYFNEAFSTDTWTLPAHMSALSSQHTSAHGINDPENAINRLQFPTIQEILSKKHYATVAFTDGQFLSAKYGFDIGFDDYHEEVGTYMNPGMKDMSKRTFNEAIQWIDEHAGVPFFIFIHTHEAHHFPITIEEHTQIYADRNYDGFFRIPAGDNRNFVSRIHEAAKDDSLVDEKDVQYAIDLYDGGIHVADREFGGFIDYLRQKGLYDDMLIILASDHGESFRNFHNNGKTLKWYHSGLPYIEQIRIPFSIKLPGKDAVQSRIDAPISLLDLAPTILDALGVPSPESFQGASLLPLIRKEIK
ncbi:MAG: sulfatase, partial [Candidatus Abyssubacteria bacterium]|nr:sulfatase [Candidatus Abyssubacteria bacterium]